VKRESSTKKVRDTSPSSYQGVKLPVKGIRIPKPANSSSDSDMPVSKTKKAVHSKKAPTRSASSDEDPKKKSTPVKKPAPAKRAPSSSNDDEIVVLFNRAAPKKVSDINDGK
jgi:hypothetical protein